MEVEYPISTHKRIEGNKTKVVDIVNLYTEGGSFISKSMFEPHLPQLLKFFKICTHIDPDIRYAKFESPISTLLLCAATKIVHKSR